MALQPADLLRRAQLYLPGEGYYRNIIKAHARPNVMRCKKCTRARQTRASRGRTPALANEASNHAASAKGEMRFANEAHLGLTARCEA